MKTLKKFNILLLIFNVIIATILTRKFGEGISLLFWGCIMLGGIEGIIFSELHKEN